MYRTADGREIFVIDAHTHLWDASPENQRGKLGKGWIDCFYAYHKNLSPADKVWTLEHYQRYSVEDMARDLFVEGYVDMCILQSTNLFDFYHTGFNPIERNAQLKEAFPERVILNGSFDPRHGEDGPLGLNALRRAKEQYDIKGVKLYTAEWHNGSRGWRLNDPAAYPFFEECERLGITNIHIHKGPTIWPLDRDSFDVADVDYVATDFPGLTFIVEHCGLPRLEDFCWIATQETNVWGGLAVAMPFIHSRPRYFAEIMANLLYWLGPDKLTFASDYALWTPGWLIEKFMAFELPEDLEQEFGVKLTLENKEKILGLNAARLYGIDVEAKKEQLRAMPVVLDGAAPATA
ncbi:amidohydrolase family protein [Chloroflexus sp.]|uniref:amidohydrolase family protein n=1 Tax=Chloroflexus sp. TaxID=1904827 RepID=UPI002613626B|nr:amidohydrolase family protein [uncultured Chloroflexus sp.]